MRTFGTSDSASQARLRAELLKRKAYGSKTVTAASVAKRINQRGLVTATEVRNVAAQITSHVTDSSGNLKLTTAGIAVARAQPSPRVALH